MLACGYGWVYLLKEDGDNSLYKIGTTRCDNVEDRIKKKPLEAKEVAQIGYTQSMKGKDFYIIGKGNRFQYFMSRFVTRKTLLKTSAKTLKAKI